MFKPFRAVISFDSGWIYVLREAMRQRDLSCIFQAMHVGSTESLVGVVLNILLFVPFGYLLPWKMPAVRRSLWKVAFYGLLLSFCVESTQLVTRLGCFDVDDLLNNMIGAAVGAFLYRVCLKKHVERRDLKVSEGKGA